MKEFFLCICPKCGKEYYGYCYKKEKLCKNCYQNKQHKKLLEEQYKIARKIGIKKYFTKKKK